MIIIFGNTGGVEEKPSKVEAADIKSEAVCAEFFHRIRVKFTLLPDKGREAARDFTR